MLKAKKGIPKRLYERLNHKIRDNPKAAKKVCTNIPEHIPNAE